MPALLMWFASFLISSLIMRFFFATGLSIISYVFINDLITQARTAMESALYGLPADFLAFIQLWKFDQGLSVVVSAFTIAGYIKTAKVIVGRSS